MTAPRKTFSQSTVSQSTHQPEPQPRGPDDDCRLNAEFVSFALLTLMFIGLIIWLLVTPQNVVSDLPLTVKSITTVTP